MCVCVSRKAQQPKTKTKRTKSEEIIFFGKRRSTDQEDVQTFEYTNHDNLAFLQILFHVAKEGAHVALQENLVLSMIHSSVDFFSLMLYSLVSYSNFFHEDLVKVTEIIQICMK